ncbi:GL22656 [Drosophila persimilis]|uniref:GL22656 n=1 Tax=Drosophila persimilis TaxID=7234 RepID=B4H050_DROPE|nr:GL22656 [Drosophila persimilis]
MSNPAIASTESASPRRDEPQRDPRLGDSSAQRWFRNHRLLRGETLFDVDDLGRSRSVAADCPPGGACSSRQCSHIRMGYTRVRWWCATARLPHCHTRHEEDHVDRGGSCAGRCAAVPDPGSAGEPRVHDTDIRQERDRSERTSRIGGALQGHDSRVPYRYKQLQKLPKAMPSVITEALDPEDADVLSNVENLVLDMARTFGVSSRDHLSTDAAGECFALACRLYYQFLQRIIGSELLLKPHLKMVQLLKQRTLSVTLVACCLELALRIREDRVEELKFPFILKCYSLDAYEFQKILELVVRHRTGLIGRDLIKHLQAVEDECLGSLMFRGDSSFWKILGKAQRVPSCKEVQAREKENALGSGPEEKPRTGFVICLCKKKKNKDSIKE